MLFCPLFAGGASFPGLADVLEIADGVYLRPGRHGVMFEQDSIANIGFIIGSQCVAVIDTGGGPTEGKALDRAIKGITTKPVCYVINTHVHPDHILGNSAFKGPDVTFVGHRNLSRAIALLGPTYLQRASRQPGREPERNSLVFPDRSVETSLRLDLGGRTLLLRAHSQAHTDNDLTVYDQQTGTLWVSDLLFIEHVPVIGGSGSVNGWLDVLDTLPGHQVQRVIPGHGPVSRDWDKAVPGLRRYLTGLRDEIRMWLADDGDLSTALDHIGYSEKGRWKMFETYHKRNVSYAYTELEWE